ncbi:hypothetical protein LIA77_10576 [Sarocladium implicatum]|nr:hypothetical protein LIA77_10576 [Sarocladium implicatum]
MERIFPRALIENWNPNPIPGLSLSAAGLLVLADLHTIAQRTAITGGSSWLDALVLAPGLHYQQAADALDRDAGPGLFAELARVATLNTNKEESSPLSPSDRFAINNTATVNYLKRLFRDKADSDDVVTIDVRSLVAAKQAGYSLSRSMSDLLHRTQKAAEEQDKPALSWLSHSLFLATPILTTVAIVFTVLLEEWWALSAILALMASRILNIWAIKQRSASRPSGSKPVAPGDSEKADKATEYTIDLGMGRRVVLRGSEGDLQAVTTQSWMRNKTNLEGYFEAAAKLIVYMVAAFSGNMTQAGSFILMSLLLVSAGCLGLSNANAEGFKMHGRVAKPERKRGERKGPVIDAEKAQQLTKQNRLETPERKVSLRDSSRAEVPRKSVYEMSRDARRQMYMDPARPIEGNDQE